MKVFRYVTEGSFDAYMWQTLETKCRFIAQVMTGDATMRRAEDVDAAALTYAEVKAIASGNPLVIEKGQHRRRGPAPHPAEEAARRQPVPDALPREDARREHANVPSARSPAIREDLRTRTSTKGDDFSMTVQKETFTDRTKAGRALVFLAAAMKPFTATKPLGVIAGFPILPPAFRSPRQPPPPRPAHLPGERQRQRARHHRLRRARPRQPSRTTLRARSRPAPLRQAGGRPAEATRPPFEHEEKLGVATRRQQEIVDALDITKNQASAKLDEGAEQSLNSVNERPQQAVSPKREKASSVTV